MAALDMQVEERIDRALDDVWKFVVIEYFEHHGCWDDAITEMTKLTPGPLGVGTRGREVRSFGGKQAAEFEVTELVEPNRFAFRNTSGPFAVERAYELHATPSGTRLVFSFRMRPKGPTKVLFPLLRSKVASQVRANIGRIPGLVEEHC